ncbi:hypothetical protein ACSSS7_005485 [Eimeria intestinalis]
MPKDSISSERQNCSPQGAWAAGTAAAITIRRHCLLIFDAFVTIQSPIIAAAAAAEASAFKRASSNSSQAEILQGIIFVFQFLRHAGKPSWCCSNRNAFVAAVADAGRVTPGRERAAVAFSDVVGLVFLLLLALSLPLLLLMVILLLLLLVRLRFEAAAALEQQRVMHEPLDCCRACCCGIC